jgi:AraC family transcriptional regulator
MSRLESGKFLGEVREQYIGAGAVLTRLRHVEGRRLPRHVHGAPYLSMLLRGGYREETPSGILDYEPLTLVFHPAETSHVDEIGPQGGTFLMIEMRGQGGEGAVAVQSRDSSLAALRLYQQWRTGTLDELSLESALPLLLTGRREASPGSWLRRVVDRLHDDFCAPVSVAELAEEAGVHPVHLARAFRKAMGLTVGEYVARLRVAWVARALASREEPDLAGLAAAAGFADQSHLTRVFKALTGSPPGKSRQMLRMM